MSVLDERAAYGLAASDGCRNCTASARHPFAGPICIATSEGYAALPAEGWCQIWMSRDGTRSALTDNERAALAAADGEHASIPTTPGGR